ncbi:hypothetical protein SESBI_12062 [Sesbania bispinosa]|nr:hypothetical protein SESBI_12062 [Sesbania bispinosa]
MQRSLYSDIIAQSRIRRIELCFCFVEYSSKRGRGLCYVLHFSLLPLHSSSFGTASEKQKGEKRNLRERRKKEAKRERKGRSHTTSARPNRFGGARDDRGRWLCGGRFHRLR